jgi:C4-dicarboxylate transporter DctM subunit
MGAILFITFVGALILGIPISMCLGLTALAGVLSVSPQALVIIPQKFLAGVNSVPLLAVPLFILAGLIMARGGVATRLVRLALVLMGRVPGGLGMVTVTSTVFFSGISGSTTADTAAIGTLTFPQMRQRGYPVPFAAALVAAAGATASLIPPSIDFIIVGVVANISIGGLFAAGVLPGAVNCLSILALTYFYGRRLKLPLEQRISLREKLRVIWEGVPPLIMAGIILYGILGGVFTPTEASAVAVAYGFILCYVFYREISLKDLPDLLLRAGALSGMILLLVGMASVVSFVLTYERIPQIAGDFIIAHSNSWVDFVIWVGLLFLFIGMVSDALPALIILMPILVPIAESLGMNPIHFAIVVVANVGLGFITPPVGLVLYVACGIAEIPLEAILRPIVPFILALLASYLAISFVPEISLFLPRLLGYTT